MLLARTMGPHHLSLHLSLSLSHTHKPQDLLPQYALSPRKPSPEDFTFLVMCEKERERQSVAHLFPFISTLWEWMLDEGGR